MALPACGTKIWPSCTVHATFKLLAEAWQWNGIHGMASEEMVSDEGKGCPGALSSCFFTHRSSPNCLNSIELPPFQLFTSGPALSVSCSNGRPNTPAFIAAGTSADAQVFQSLRQSLPKLLMGRFDASNTCRRDLCERMSERPEGKDTKDTWWEKKKTCGYSA